MSKLSAPRPGLIFASILYNSKKYSQEECLRIWHERYPHTIQYWPDVYTMNQYYANEMGPNLERFFTVSTDPVSREELLSAKLWAQEVETKYAQDGQRQINMDIGLICDENVQLATGKNFTHRIYLGSGVFSDLTLLFQNDTYVGLPWSYPDYNHEKVIHFFNSMRSFLRTSLNSF